MDEDTADWWALKGANQMELEKQKKRGHERPNVLWFVPRKADPGRPTAIKHSAELEKHKVRVDDAFPAFQNDCEYYAGNWKVVRPKQVPTAEVVVLIRGRDGTADVYRIAKKKGIPVVPVPFYRGTAARVFKRERKALAAIGVNVDSLDSKPPSIKPSRVVEVVVQLLSLNRKNGSKPADQIKPLTFR